VRVDPVPSGGISAGGGVGVIVCPCGRGDEGGRGEDLTDGARSVRLKEARGDENRGTVSELTPACNTRYHGINCEET
jgi:hypothetical protein